MRDRCRRSLVLAFVVLGVAIAGSRPPALSLDELVAKHVAARGGLEALRAVQTLRLTGRLIFEGSGFKLAYREVLKRPGLARVEYSTQGLTGVQAWNGKEGWQIAPFQGRKDPERTSRDDNKGLIDDADLDGPLVDTAATGSTLTYLGTEDIDGTDAHKIKVTQADGDTATVYLDPDYFLTIRTRYEHKVRGAETVIETDVGNYEKIGGVLIPFSSESGPPGAPRSQKLVLDKAEVNVPADDAAFSFPAGKGKE